MKAVLVHFDVDEHFVLLETFVSSARAAEIAVKSISKGVFGNQLDFDLVIIPPESGSLKQYIGVIVRGTLITYASLWAFVQMMDSPSVQEISIELTGKTPSQLIVERVHAFTFDEKVDFPDQPVDSDDLETLEEFIALCAKGALEKPRSELRGSSIPEEMRFEIESAQSELYGAALADPQVRALGFTESDDFPIQRNQFAERAIAPAPIKPRDEDDSDWKVEVQRVRVTSPNFDRVDQSSRKWKGRYTNGGLVLFEIDDEEFWQKLSHHEFDFTDTTELQVQMATRFVDGRPKENRGLRVISIDGLEIAKPLADDAIAAQIGRFSHTKSNLGQGDLFGG